ncbi:MAG: hypothetical protein ABI839_06065 [Verrucomicrobiota bacterium]
MNPDKLFDYLDGRLPEHERHALEEQLMNEAPLRRELEVARRIHAGMREHKTERREILEEQPATTALRGRKLGRQILAAAMFLIALNVAFGLYLIARHEASNPNRALLKKQSEDQLRQALDHAATAAMTPPSLGVLAITATVASHQAENVARKIAQVAQQLGGKATEGVPDNGRVQVLVEIERGTEFAKALRAIEGVQRVESEQETPLPDQKRSLIVQVREGE